MIEGTNFHNINGYLYLFPILYFIFYTFYNYYHHTTTSLKMLIIDTCFIQLEFRELV